MMMASSNIIGMRVEIIRQKLFEEIYDRRTERTTKFYKQINFNNPMYKYRSNLNVTLKNYKSKRFFWGNEKRKGSLIDARG